MARALIGAGEVLVNDRPAEKPGTAYHEDCDIRLKKKCPYVSRGGLKLQAAIEHFRLDPQGWTCIDIGASTGGFSDCLLQNNAAKIFAIDVAYGQLSWKIRNDPRIVVIERFNARHLSSADLGGISIDLAVLDISFISLTSVLPCLPPLFGGQVRIVALIKPQFELAREDIGAGGVVVDAQLHIKAQNKILDFCQSLSLRSLGIIPSPLLGPKGNKEFLIYIVSP